MWRSLMSIAASGLWLACACHGQSVGGEKWAANTRQGADSGAGGAQVLNDAVLVLISSGTGILELTDPLARVSGPVDSLNTIPNCRREESDVDVGYPLGVIEISDPIAGTYTVRILSAQVAMVSVSGMWVGAHHHSCGDSWAGEKRLKDNAPLTFRFAYEAVGDGDSCVVKILEDE